MSDALSSVTAPLPSVGHSLLVLVVAALLGAALGIIRPVRAGIVPRSAHVIQTQVLLAIVGAVIIVVVAESLARAFAIVGAAGLVRYRARVDDVKDAGVMLVALALGLTAGRSRSTKPSISRRLCARARGGPSIAVGETGRLGMPRIRPRDSGSIRR